MLLLSAGFGSACLAFTAPLEMLSEKDLAC